jgi:hypothetical protein
MFKSKKGVYILIPLNVLIWGFFIYRFYSAYADSDLPVVAPGERSLKLEGLKDSIAYKLNLKYKDPFLKETVKDHRSYSPSLAGDQSQKKSVPVRTPTPVIKQLPEVRYLGLIKNNSSGITTALVSVNGQSKLIRQNETFDGIIFKSFNKDSLVARWGKERIVVRK